MLKTRTIRLFLMLGVLLFSIVVVGCSNNKVNASYILTHFESEDIEGEFGIVELYRDLVFLLKNDIPEKYVPSFFEEKSLIVFKVFENSQGSKSEIKSYRIKDRVITIDVEMVELGDDTAMGYWWFILELEKDKMDDIDSIRIIKNGNEIINEVKSKSLTKYDYYHSYSFSSVEKWPDFIGGNYNLGFKERRYYFILTFSELKNIFESSTGYEIKDYFDEKIFNENYVLCIVRDETSGTLDVRYSNFKVNDLELSIEETIISGGATVVSRYLDFVVIPKKLFPSEKYDSNIEYNWQ